LSGAVIGPVSAPPVPLLVLVLLDVLPPPDVV
jgi:hypothetical protein